MRRLFSAALPIAGLIFVAAAAVVRFAVAPAVALLPSNIDTTRYFSGTAPVLVNTAALLGSGPLVLHDVPVQLSERAQVRHTSGDNALVDDTRSATPAGGQPVVISRQLAVNRHSLGPADASFEPGALHPTGPVFNWPIGVSAQDYVGWVLDTHTDVTMHYAGTAERGGIKTYVFQETLPPTPLTDPAELAVLPQSVPKSLVPALLSRLGAPASQARLFAAFAARLPAVIPLSYTFATTTTYWVDPTTGTVISVHADDVRAAGLPASVVGLPVQLATVSEFRYDTTPASVAAAAADAKSKGSGLRTVQFTLPLALLVAGLLMFAVGSAGWLLPRRHRPWGGPTDRTGPLPDGAPANEPLPQPRNSPDRQDTPSNQPGGPAG